MTLGRFKTVDLNLAGWSALLAPGVAVGAAAALVVDRRLVVAGIAGGGAVAFAVGHVVDELRDRRRWQWVPVASGDAAPRLRRLGVVVLDHTVADVRGRWVHFLAVRQRDARLVGATAGLPAQSHRARRRRSQAEVAAVRLPPPADHG